jgi:hypothetical protein
VTASDVADAQLVLKVVSLCNLVPGPYVVRDTLRGGGFGLVADRDYAQHEVVTTYGGVEFAGVLAPSSEYRMLLRVSGEEGDDDADDDDNDDAGAGNAIDGHHDFQLCEKGRWVNEFSGGVDAKDRHSRANVTWERKMIATRPIAKYEWIFANYGASFDRTY